MKYYLIFRPIALLLFFSLVSGWCWSQSYKISGVVKDAETNSPLDFASIYIKTGDEKIFAYTNTDELGQYEILFEYKGDSLKISANTLGYQEQSYVIEPSNQKILVQDFVLSSSPYELNEITVRETAIPVFERNDTTTYNLSSFIDSTEYSVEDVLKKLPGIQINNEGAISVNGKPIDKVLIEGDDMFGANYTIGTRNIRADAIDKVRLIDHFEDNPALKNLGNSDKTVLDLSIKEKRKRVLSGTATLGAGYGEKAKMYLHTNLFSFSKKSKSFLLGNLNNIGFNAIGELNATFNGFGTNQSIESGKINMESLVSLPNVQKIGLPEYFTNNKQLGLINLSQVFNLSKQFKLKFRGTHVKEKNHQLFYYQNTFLNTGDTLNFREDNNFSRTGNLYDVTIQAEYFPLSKKSSFKTYSNLAFQKNGIQSFISRKDDNKTSEIPFTVQEKPLDVFNAIEYTRKIGKNAMGQLVLDNSNRSIPELLHSSYQQYPLFFNLDSSLVELRQKSSISKHQSSIAAKYIYNKNILLSVQLGYIFNTTSLKSDANIQNDNTTGAINISKNDLAINQSSPFIKFSLKKKINKIAFSSGINTSFTQANIQNETIRFQEKYWKFSPFLKIEIPFSDDMKLSLLYTYKESSPQEKNLNNNFLFTDYQTTKVGLLNLSPMRTNSFGGTFRYRDILKSFYLNAYLKYSFSNNGHSNNFNFTSGLFEKQAFRPNAVAAIAGGTSVEKFFQKVNSKILLRYNFSSHTAPNIINEIHQKTRFSSHQIFLDYGSAFDGWFNLYFKNGILFSRTITKSTLSDLIVNATNWNSNVKLLFKPNKRFYIDVNWYAISTNIQNGFENWLSTADLNATFVFKISKKRNELKLSLVNILAQDTFTINSVNSYVQYQYGLKAVPRFFILKWDVSL